MKKLPLWVQKDGGLSFSCTRCGDCCGGFAGFVWVSEPEITALAEHLKLTLTQFGTRYLRRVDTRISLVEKANHDCVFWEKGVGCTVYEARPTQCRTYPFWPEVVRSRESWREEAKRCPGVRQAAAEGSSARRFSSDEIEKLLNGIGET